MGIVPRGAVRRYCSQHFHLKNSTCLAVERLIMIAAIMQPTFLPWIGYFDLIDQSDVFVFLDDVQFEKQSWQQRNRVRSPIGLDWLTVPVYIKGRSGQTIREVEIKSDIFPDKHIKTLKQHYSKCGYFSEYWQELESILLRAKQDKSLADLNISLIRWLADLLGISSQYVLASNLKVEDRRSQRLLRILKSINADTYLSPRGSMEYLIEDRQIFEDAELPIVFQSFTQPIYNQRYAPFQSGVSAIDLLFNEGASSTADLMRLGRQLSENFEDLITQNKDASI